MGIALPSRFRDPSRFLKGEYGDCISVGSKTRVISSQTISSMLRQQPRPAAHRAKFELKGADVNETIS
jgi:hypothetical protein